LMKSPDIPTMEIGVKDQGTVEQVVVFI